MIPLYDDNPTIIRPLVTIGLIAACALVFLWELTLSEPSLEQAIYAYGFVPGAVLGDPLDLPVDLSSSWFGLFTSMFLHGGWMHLIGNMLYLWIFGNNIEDAMGHARFVLFYLLCGVGAAAAQAGIDPSSMVPMIGASGAISGVLGGYLLLFPRAKVVVLLPLGVIAPLFRLPAMLVLGLWFALQLVNAQFQASGESGVAFWAHIGGFVAGMILIYPFKRPGSPPTAGENAMRSAKPGRRFAPWGRRGPWG